MILKTGIVWCRLKEMIDGFGNGDELFLEVCNKLIVFILLVAIHEWYCAMVEVNVFSFILNTKLLL